MIMTANTRAARSPLSLFVLVFMIGIPLALVGRSLGVIGAMKIPVSDLGLAFVRERPVSAFLTAA